ncbi:tigger transposable element-derived protein 4 [Rhipicephalus sanguineus]|uniref:tigger transposable element-derived protein 4 n=1 Tax=Rhipicephalus sanguineus TaxID=34632 RepID=UPI0018933905|nr:tigger transposable element-derived protein 4 [Rhipicephalus sanguineus]
MEKKAAIIKQVQSGRSQAEVGREFGISKQTVSDFIKNKAKILEVAAKSTGAGKKNASHGVYPQLEEALLVWLSAMIAKKIPVSGDILKQKAEVFALQMNVKDFKFSDGWLRNFKSRNDLKFKKMCGESGAVNDSVVAEYRDGKLQSLLQQFPPNDIFNCNETGLFYKLLPEKTLAFAGDPCHGGKHSKERLTVLVGSNMSGSEKLPLLVIAILQPMDQGVIRNLKHHYKSRVLSRMVLCSDSGKSYAVDLRSAVGMLAESWKAVTQETLRNCFRHAGFTLDAETAVSPQVDNVCDELPSADVAFDYPRCRRVDSRRDNL